jgi:hypothetical protein
MRTAPEMHQQHCNSSYVAWVYSGAMGLTENAYYALHAHMSFMTIDVLKKTLP